MDNINFSLEQLKDSLKEVQKMTDSLTSRLDDVPKTENNQNEINDLYVMLQIIQDVSNEILSQNDIKLNDEKDIPMQKEEEKEINANILDTAEKKVNSFYLEKETLMEQIKENKNTIISSLKTILKLLMELANSIKNEIVSIPAKKINDIKTKISDKKYENSKNVVLAEIKANTEVINEAVKTIEKANKMLTSLENKEIKPLGKKSILKQLQNNQSEIKKIPSKSQKTQDTCL